MRTVSAPAELSTLLRKYPKNQHSIGLVPTMGALHHGHVQLITRSTKENDLTIVSIFVNPIQFNSAEDLERYPRTLDQDTELLKELEVDYIFAPQVEDLYPEKPSISIDFGEMAQVLEGAFRPGHFDGVGIVVSKLLNIVNPDRAYFGLKDLQQFLLIKKMCRELSFQAEIVGVETVREASGLAMSSRNQRLSKGAKEIASSIYRGLKRIQTSVEGGAEITNALEEAKTFFHEVDGLELEYLEAVNPSDLTSIGSSLGLTELAVCFAGYVEGIRLIDNLYLRLK